MKYPPTLGFRRKTRFGDGKIWLNDPCTANERFHLQRTSNEWRGVGMSIPARLSDYSNGLMTAYIMPIWSLDARPPLETGR